MMKWLGRLCHRKQKKPTNEEPPDEKPPEYVNSSVAAGLALIDPEATLNAIDESGNNKSCVSVRLGPNVNSLSLKGPHGPVFVDVHTKSQGTIRVFICENFMLTGARCYKPLESIGFEPTEMTGCNFGNSGSNLARLFSINSHNLLRVGEQPRVTVWTCIGDPHWTSFRLSGMADAEPAWQDYANWTLGRFSQTKC